MSSALPISKPSIGVSGLTGHWRLKKPKIDYKRCVKCHLCWLYCPDSTIDVDDLSNVTIDYRYCKGCGICASVCPTKAIVMVDEHGS